MSDTEWAVQYRSYLNGKFDRTVIHDSEAKARYQVKAYNAKAKKGGTARLAKRPVGQFEAVDE